MTQYHRYLKSWTSERGITSFLGSDKPAFQRDWKEEKKGLRFGEMESMGGEDINRAGEPFKKPKPKISAAESVFTNPDLLKQIGAFTNPKKMIKVDDFFEKNKAGDMFLNRDKIQYFLFQSGLGFGIYKGKPYYKDYDQYEKLLEILAERIYGIKPFRDTRYVVRDKYGEVERGSYQKYNDAIRIPALKKVFANLLEKKLPANFNYDGFWRDISNIGYPIMTRINNVQMKKLFSNWENKGKRYKVAYKGDPRDEGFA